jgi:hypothetical protein
VAVAGPNVSVLCYPPYGEGDGDVVDSPKEGCGPDGAAVEALVAVEGDVASSEEA